MLNVIFAYFLVYLIAIAMGVVSVFHFRHEFVNERNQPLILYINGALILAGGVLNTLLALVIVGMLTIMILYFDEGVIRAFASISYKQVLIVNAVTSIVTMVRLLKKARA